VNTRLIRMEMTLYRRDFGVVFFGAILGPLVVVILGSIPAFRVHDPDLGGQSVVGLYVPIVLAMAIGMMGLSTLPSVLATYRERGVVRRLSTTPVRPLDLLMAQAVVQTVILFAASIVVVLIGWLAFGVHLPRNPLGFLLAYGLTIVAMFGIGLMLASANTAKMAAVLGSVLFFPMMFFAGLYIPREVMPQALRSVGDFSPLGAAVQSLQDASAGHWPRALHLVVLALWGVVAWLGAVRLFRPALAR
jgi:ABC-2 type transport system permease protein